MRLQQSCHSISHNINRSFLPLGVWASLAFEKFHFYFLSITKAQWKPLISPSLSTSPRVSSDLFVPAINWNFKLALHTHICIINALQSKNNMRKKMLLMTEGERVHKLTVHIYSSVSAWIVGNVVLLHPKNVEKRYFTKQNLHFPPPPHHIHHHIYYPHFPVISKGLLHLSQAPALQPAAAPS